MIMHKGFIDRIKHTISTHNLLAPPHKNDKPVLVALSGGADSVALLHIMLQLGYTCVAAHCNFHLRGEESMRDEHFASSLCHDLGVQCHTTSFDTHTHASTHGISIEMAARNLRYAYFNHLIEANNYACVAVAHHKDDNAETILLNIVRGTGLHGAMGMPYHNEHVIRPLLDVSRAEILRYLESKKQAYITDSSNAVADVKRNIIRLRIMPILKELNPSITDTLIRNAANFREAAEFINCHTKQAQWQYMPDGTMFVPKHSVNSHLALFLLTQKLGFTPSQINDIWQKIHSTTSASYLCRNYELIRNRDSLILIPLAQHTSPTDIHITIGSQATLMGQTITTSIIQAPQEITISRHPSTACLDADKVGANLILRKVQQGDRFVPFGMNGSKLISRYMADKKFNAVQKQKQLVLANDKDIVWLVGQRPDDRYRVIPDQTRSILIVNVASI